MRTPIRALALCAGFLGAAATWTMPEAVAAQEVSGTDVWAANCGSCHRFRSSEAYTASQWNAIATHMGLVARLTPAETRAVREFLVGSARARQAAEAVRDLTPTVVLTETTTAGGAAGALRLRPAQGGQAAVSGRDVYRARCAACHGAAGRGDGPAAAAMNPRPSSFADSARRQATTDFAMGEVIQHGRRSMPAFGRTLTRAQIDSVIAYVKTLSR